MIDAACDTYKEKSNCMQGFGGDPEGKTPLGRPYTDGAIILKWTRWYEPDSSGSGQGKVAGSCEHINGTSVRLKYGEFLD
jgi:hypothetical protein